MIHSLSEVVKNVGDVLSLGVVVGWLAAVLPVVSTALAIVWFGFRIHDRIKYGPSKDKD